MEPQHRQGTGLSAAAGHKTRPAPPLLNGKVVLLHFALERLNKLGPLEKNYSFLVFMNIEYFKETWSRASPAVLVASSPSPTTLLGFFLELLRSHVVGIAEPL